MGGNPLGAILAPARNVGHGRGNILTSYSLIFLIRRCRMAVEEKSARLNLSVKQLTPDPWQKIADKYPEGTKVKGEITRIASFGAFVNLAPGVDGLIHISKIPADKAFKAGQKIDCFVESVNVEERRMSLSLALISKPVGYK